MKTIIQKYLSIIFVLGSLLLHAEPPTADHLTIAEKFRFYYFDDVTSADRYLIRNSDVRSGTESGDFWSDSGLSSFHEFLRALLKAPANGGDASLQHYAAKLVKVNDRPIVVYLWNDPNPVDLSTVVFSNRPCLNGGQVWPCASHWTEAQNSYWGGYMHIGLNHINRPDRGQPWVRETFLHELMHTQDKTLQLGNSFVVMGNNYRYGLDGTHYFSEATPNKRLAYMESIANVAPMYYHFNEFERWFNWFTSNSYIMVETSAPANWVRMLNQLFGSGYSDNVWLYQQINEAVGPGQTMSGYPNYRRYRIQDLPAKFIVHNEMVVALMMTMTSMHVAEIEPFLWATKTFNTRITANQNQDPYALFVKIFAEGMLQDGETIAAIKQELDSRTYSSATVDTPYTFILPLAYSDYFTGYTSASKNDFKALFNNEMDNDLIDIYWDHFKDRVRGSVAIQSGRTWSDMTDIAIQCGVNQSYLPGTSGRRYEGSN